MVTHPSDTEAFDSYQEGGIMAPQPAFTADAQPVDGVWNEHRRTESPLVRRNPRTLCEEHAS